jgi:hypothetical protein
MPRSVSKLIIACLVGLLLIPPAQAPVVPTPGKLLIVNDLGSAEDGTCRGDIRMIYGHDPTGLSIGVNATPGENCTLDIYSIERDAPVGATAGEMYVRSSFGWAEYEPQVWGNIAYAVCPVGGVGRSSPTVWGSYYSASQGAPLYQAGNCEGHFVESWAKLCTGCDSFWLKAGVQGAGNPYCEGDVNTPDFHGVTCNWQYDLHEQVYIQTWLGQVDAGGTLEFDV